MSNGNEKLRDRVQKRLAEIRELDRAGIRVDVDRRVVTLRGTVEDPRLRALAESAAREAAAGAEVKSELGTKPEWGEERGPMATEFGTKQATERQSSTHFDRMT